MVGLIIATHGNTCAELVKSAEMFSGPLKNCETWTLNPGDSIELGEKNWSNTWKVWMKVPAS